MTVEGYSGDYPGPVSYQLNEIRSAHFLELVAEASTRLLLATDPAKMVDELFEMLRTELDLDVFFNYRVTSDNMLRLETNYGLSEAQLPEWECLEMGQAVCGRVALERRPYYCDIIQNSDDPLVTFIKGLGLKAYACTPLMVGKQLVGTLGFGRRYHDRFDEEELTFLRTICQFVAIAKNRINVARQLQEQEAARSRITKGARIRVANALAVVASILSMEADGATGETRQALARTIQRVNAIVTGHLHLVGVDDLASVELDNFLSHIAADISLGNPSWPPFVVERGRSLYLPIERALPVGLLVHELIQSLRQGKSAPSVSKSSQKDRISIDQDKAGSFSLRFEGINICKRLDSQARASSDRVIQLLTSSLNAQVHDVSPSVRVYTMHNTPVN